MFDSSAHHQAAARLEEGSRQYNSLTVAPIGSVWTVRGSLLPRLQRFPTKEQAIAFARHWARDNTPSVVRLEIDRGEVAGEWEYADTRS
jgi:hypothetical protein